MWRYSVVLCALLAVAFAGVAQGPLLPKPEKFKDVEGCYLPELNTVIAVETSAPSKSSCMEYRCYANALGYIGCPSVGVGPGMKLVEDKSKPYPECCPTPAAEK